MDSKEQRRPPVALEQLSFSCRSSITGRRTTHSLKASRAAAGLPVASAASTYVLRLPTRPPILACNSLCAAALSCAGRKPALTRTYTLSCTDAMSSRAS